MFSLIICSPYTNLINSLRGLTVACWIIDHYQPCSNLGVGISDGCFIFDFDSLRLEVDRPIQPTMCTKVAVKHQSSSNPIHSHPVTTGQSCYCGTSYFNSNICLSHHVCDENTAKKKEATQTLLDWWGLNKFNNEFSEKQFVSSGQSICVSRVKQLASSFYRVLNICTIKKTSG